MPNNPRPTRIRLDKPAKRLLLAWSDGVEHSLPWDYLRVRCPSAGEVVAREKKSDNPLAVLAKVPSAELVNLRMVGTYALSPTWGDGHSAGIYTWEYLREIAEQLANKS